MQEKLLMTGFMLLLFIGIVYLVCYPTEVLTLVPPHGPEIIRL